MKAVLCKAWGPPEGLVVEDVPSPQPNDDEVVVSIHACGMNFPDTLLIQGKYQVKPPLPFSPGGEFAGVIKAVGAKVRRFKVGDRVAAMPLIGGYAEEAVVAQDAVVSLAQGIDFADAAAFLITYGTAHYALQGRAKIQPGETLLVLGAAGGNGLAAIELGKLLGARVIAAASTDEKLALCRAHGADATINYSSEDLRGRIQELTGGRGIDVVYDPVGGPYSEPALRAMAWNGRFLVIGFTAGEIPKIGINLPLLKGCSIVGVLYGSFLRIEPGKGAMMREELLHWLGQGRLRPYISARLPLEQAAAGLRSFLERKVTGKIVLITARSA